MLRLSEELQPALQRPIMLHATGLPFLSAGHGTLVLHVGEQIVNPSVANSRHVAPAPAIVQSL